MDRKVVSAVSANVALTLAYVGVAKLGLMMDAVSGFATLVWPPTGIALAALLVFGYRLWPGIAVGAFAVNVWTGAHPLAALGIAFGNTTEAVLAAVLLRRFGVKRSLERLRDVVALIALGAIVSTTVAASFGVLSLAAGGVVRAGHAAETWRAWWVGDALGDLVVAPVLLTWAFAPKPRWNPVRLAEIVLLAAAFATVSIFVFLRPFAPRGGPFEQPYLVFPLLVWAALRFGLRGATAMTFVLAAVAVWGTARGTGPFAGESLGRNLLFLQTFMGVAAATSLVLGGAIADRGHALGARNEVIAIVSHDLGNPVNSIKLSSGLLLGDMSLPSSQRRTLEIIGRAADRMTRLIRDLLDFAAIDAGRMSLELREEDACKLVREVVDLEQPLAEERKQTLVAEAQGELWVRCDNTRTLQVLSNLIGNALKFSPDGARVVVRVERAAGAGKLSVVDAGRGMTATEARQAFDRYWQATPEAHKGSGLGLSIAKGLVEAQGGTIWVESTPGSGSTFAFTLPTARPRS